MVALRARPPADAPPPLLGVSWAEFITLVGELNAALDPSELFAALGPLLRRVLDHHCLAVYLPQSDERLGRVYAEGEDAPPESVAPGEGLVGRAAESREPRASGEAFALPLLQGDRLV